MPIDYTAEEWKKKLTDIENNNIKKDNLDLGNKKLDKEKIEELIAALQTNYQNYQAHPDLDFIKWIDFNDTELNDDLIQRLATGLQSIDNDISIINLTTNNFINTNCLITFLKLKNLTTLKLANNQISDETLKPFAQALGDKNCQLKNLDLGNNNLGNAGSVKLILKHNISLEYIDFSSNAFTDNTMENLAAGFNTNKTVKKINLDSCQIVDDDISNLFKNENQISFEKLYIGDNNITEECEEFLREEIGSYPSLEIHLSNDQKISAELISSLSKHHM